MIRYYIAGILVALVSSVGQICFKFASRRMMARPPAAPLRRMLDLGLDPWFLSGGFLFVAAAATSVWVLVHMEFSVYYSLSALNYLFITLLSRQLLLEPIDGRKIAGNAIIIAGILLYSLH